MKILSGAEIKALQAQGALVVVDFYADWCGPCKMLTPIIEELAKEYEGKVEIVKLNVDNDNEFAREYGVMSIPTIISFKGDKPVAQSVGYKPKAEIEKLVQGLL
ncbi:MAG: thioredoxin [Erysipelotrichales bacterium]|nr:thioredoxin [Erysipelotrichales bacterium]